MVKIKGGIDEAIIDHFTLQSSHGSQHQFMVSGRMKSCDKDFIYVEVVEADVGLLQSYCDRQYFDIVFHMNRIGYQLQHRALRYMEKHNLHSILINNKHYEHVDEDNVGDLFDHSLESADTLNLALNSEQKIAVDNIARSTDNSIPYLLFGPAGGFSIGN